jgi:hypothetical protein
VSPNETGSGWDRLTLAINEMHKAAPPDVQCALRMFHRLKQKTQMRYGIQGEARVREIHNRHCRQPIVDAERHFCKLLPEIPVLAAGPAGFAAGATCTWTLEGNIDGMRAGKLVEIKYRTTQLLDDVPMHDKIQLHAYMFLTEQPSAILIQCIQPEENVLFTDQREVCFEPAFWQDLLRRLARCVELLQQLHNQPLAREFFALLSDEARADVLRSHTA